MADEITPDSLLERVARAPRAEPPRPPSIPERYDVRGVLGEGGFGVVYDVFDRVSGERVALKALHRLSADSRLRLKREFRALVDLRHPNLIRLHELAGDGDELHFTMERLAGAQPFDAWVAGDEGRLREGVRQLATGLRALHAAGVLHRDLKPSNVLVTPEGRVVLLDFGLARELATDASTQLAGTPLYMAPEQGVEGPLTAAVDLYALGVMLFVALSGRHPFEGRALAMLVDKQTTDAPPVASLAPAAPADLAAMTDALLSRDPALRPDAAAILAALGEAPSAAPLALHDEVWVGREPELAALRAAAHGGRAVLVRVDGRSGVGKTALVDRFCRELRDGAWVLRGRCHPRESVPFKAFDEVVDQLARRLAKDPDARALLPRDVVALAALFPVLRTVAGKGTFEGDAPSRRRRGLAALRELLARIAEERRVVIVIDDLQWGDADSASLLVELLREPEAPKLCVIATQRSGEAGALAERFDSLVAADVQVRVETLGLDHLDPTAARSLAEALTNDPERAAHVALHSQGHPQFLAELARHGEATDLDSLIRRRLEALSPSALELLRATAIAGHPVAESVLATVADQGAADDLEWLARERLVQLSPRGARAYHDRIGELVVASTPPPVASRLHLRLAEALLEGDGDPERIAMHFDEAGDARAAEHMLRAAERAKETLAFARAAELYRRTLDLRGRTDLPRPEALRLELARAEALGAYGHASDAADAYLQAASLAPREQAVELRALAGKHLVLGGHVDRAFAVFRSVLDDLGLRLPTSLAEATARIVAESARLWIRRRLEPQPLTAERRARLEALWSAYSALVYVSPLYGLVLAQMFVSEAQTTDDPRHRFRAACVEAFVRVSQKGAAALGESRAQIARAYADVASLGDPRMEVERKYMEAFMSHFGGDIALSVEQLRECIELGSSRGVAWELESAASRGILSSAYFTLGDVPSARRYAPRLVVEANGRDQLLVWSLAAYHHWWVLTLQKKGDFMSERARDEIVARWRTRGNELQDWWKRIADFHIALARGDTETAYERISLHFLSAARQKTFASRYHHLEGRCYVGRGAVALAAEDPARRPALLREAEGVRAELRAEPSDWTLALSIGIEAGIHSVRGETEEARRSQRALIAAADAAGLVLLAALARLALGTSEGDEALLAEAWAFFEDAEMEDPLGVAHVYLPGCFRPNGEA